MGKCGMILLLWFHGVPGVSLTQDSARFAKWVTTASLRLSLTDADIIFAKACNPRPVLAARAEDTISNSGFLLCARPHDYF